MKPSTPAAIFRHNSISKFKDWKVEEAILKSYFYEEAFRYTITSKPYISFLGPYIDSADFTPEDLRRLFKADYINGKLYFHTLQEAYKWIMCESTNFIPKD